jgi:hypothetical protein
MSTFARRLSALEGKLRPKTAELLGSYEEHYTEAWPDCKDMPGIEAQQCTEHGPSCAVVITRISAPIHRVIVMQGAKAGPWMGTA